MTAKSIAYLAAALALVGTLSTCQPAKAQTNVLAEYIAALPPEIQREPHAIRAALKRPVVTLVTEPERKVRSANQKELVRAVVPALATREAFRDAADKDKFLDDLIAAKWPAATLGEVRRLLYVQTLRMAIIREGLETAGDESDATVERVRVVEGPPRWQALGLAELPSMDAIRGAQQ